MIQANELRIGNWVELEGLICQLNTTTFIAVLQGRFNELKPIPITEDILLDLWFDKVREYFTMYNEFDIFLDKSGYYTHINGGNIYLKSLHQLQNLYYATVGSELNLQL